ncbi:hypothetical protein YC2023_053027 [Brassica napus]
MQQLLLRGSLREVTEEKSVNEKRNTNNMDALMMLTRGTRRQSQRKAQYLGLEDEDVLKELLVGLYPETIKNSCLELNRSKGRVRAGEVIKCSRLGSS